MPRMWMVQPFLMCSSHLKKEHGDLHLVADLLSEEIPQSIVRSANKGKISSRHLKNRHEEITTELRERGIDLCCEIPDLHIARLGWFNKGANRQELSKRCPRCREKIEEFRREITFSFEKNRPMLESLAKRIAARYRADETELLSEAFWVFLNIHENRLHDPERSAFSSFLYQKVSHHLFDVARHRIRVRKRHDEEADVLLIPQPEQEMKDYDILSWDAQRVIRLILECPEELCKYIFDGKTRRGPKTFLDSLRSFLSLAGWDRQSIDKSFAEISDLFSPSQRKESE